GSPCASGSSMVTAKGSRSACSACAKLTLCLARLAFAFAGSNSMFTHPVCISHAYCQGPRQCAEDAESANVEGERPARSERRAQRRGLPVRFTDQLDANRGQAHAGLRYSSQRFQPAPPARTESTVTTHLGGSADGEAARRRQRGDSHQTSTAVHRYNASSSRRPGQVVLRVRHLTCFVSEHEPNQHRCLQ